MNIPTKSVIFVSSTCSLCSCSVRVWRWRHIHAGFHWSYHLEEVSKRSAAGTRSAERWHFEETVTALRRTRDREQRGRDPETITETQREDFLWNPFFFCYTLVRACFRARWKQSPTVREGRKFRGAPPLKCFFRVSYVTFQGGKNAEIKWIWHFCNEASLWAAHGCDFHEVGNVYHSTKGTKTKKIEWIKSIKTPGVANSTHTPPSVVLLWIHVVTGDAPTSLLQDTLML